MRRIEGQVRGVQRLVEEDRYCMDLLTQTAAIKQALSSVEDLILKNHLETHIVEYMKKGKYSKAIEELITVYKQSKKK